MDYANKSIIWHTRLGHIGAERITRLARVGLLGLLASIILPTCEKCLADRSTRKTFGNAKRTLVLLDLIHSDIYVPFNVKSQHECSYYITFINDYSRYDHVYLISYKFEAVRCF